MIVLRTPRALLVVLPLLSLAACADPLSLPTDPPAAPSEDAGIAADTPVVAPAIDPRLEPTGNPDPQ